MASDWGQFLHLQIFGESHGPGIGVVMEGLPAGEQIDLPALQEFLRRRAPGQGKYATTRKETDAPEFLSGLLDGCTTGSPLTALIRNSDTRSSDYAALRDVPRRDTQITAPKNVIMVPRMAAVEGISPAV